MVASHSTSEAEASAEAQSRRQHAVVVMGVTGCGKSSVAAGIAAELGLACVDGDDLHDPASVAKMRAGLPLTDDDRGPWLDRIGARLARAAEAPGGVVIACSALRRDYRDRLRAAATDVRFIFLDGPHALILSRLERRTGHYMPVGLLDSQLRTLERPGADEPDVLTLEIAPLVATLVEQAVAALRQPTWPAHG
jgi:carbohydrate kinase (thermoresistant glucokinase family)